MSYTDALSQVMVQLGRIDGKLDSFDSRLRSVEEQQAAWRELVRTQEPESERWKQRIEKQGERLEVLESRRSLGDAIKHYWYVVLFIAVPVVANTAYVMMHLYTRAP
jgi:cytochrome c-type biogenesis protein CcmH/NrfG